MRTALRAARAGLALAGVVLLAACGSPPRGLSVVSVSCIPRAAGCSTRGPAAGHGEAPSCLAALIVAIYNSGPTRRSHVEVTLEIGRSKSAGAPAAGGGKLLPAILTEVVTLGELGPGQTATLTFSLRAPASELLAGAPLTIGIGEGKGGLYRATVPSGSS